MAQEMGGWTMRTGRTVRHERSKGDSWVFRKVLLPILAAIVLVGIPWGLYSAEWYYKHLALAFNELDDAVIHLGTLEPNALLPLSNRPVGFHSSSLRCSEERLLPANVLHALVSINHCDYCGQTSPLPILKIFFDVDIVKRPPEHTGTLLIQLHSERG